MGLLITDIRKTFGPVVALDGVSLAIDEGSLVCFLGPSGCGKTTLLRVLAGLELPDSGSIVLKDRDLSSVPARNRNFGMVFQSYSLFPNMTAAGNVAYGLECRRWARKDRAARVDELLSMMRLEDQSRKYPHQMSGGQQQRVALARALAPNPEVLLLDEPLSALDAKVREELREEIRMLQRKLGITTVLVTHDQEEALTMADRLVVMNDGKIMQSGTPMDVYRTPDNPFVAGFIGRMNIVPAHRGIPYPSNGLSGGRKARTLGVRPEDISLSSPGRNGQGLVGVVDHVSRLGNLARITVRLAHDDGKDRGIPIRIVSEIQGYGEDLEPGSFRSVSIDPDAVRVLEWE